MTTLSPVILELLRLLSGNLGFSTCQQWTRTCVSMSAAAKFANESKHLGTPGTGSICCNGQGQASVILVTIIWHLNWDKMLRNSYRGNQDKTRVRAVSKSYLLCYTRERVRGDEKEILQHLTTSLYIHFVCHAQTIPYAPMYHLNISS